jgi:hypothetical protein
VIALLSSLCDYYGMTVFYSFTQPIMWLLSLTFMVMALKSIKSSMHLAQDAVIIHQTFNQLIFIFSIATVVQAFLIPLALWPPRKKSVDGAFAIVVNFAIFVVQILLVGMFNKLVDKANELSRRRNDLNDLIPDSYHH